MNLLKKLSIAQKLTALAVAGLGMMIVISVSAVSAMGSLSDAAHRLAEIPPVVEAIGLADMSHDASAIQMALAHDAQMAGDGAARDEAIATAETEVADITTELAAARAADLDPAMNEVVDSVMPTVDAFSSATTAYAAALRSGEGIEAASAAYDTAFDALAVDLEKPGQEIVAHTEEINGSVADSESSGRNLIILFSLLAIAVTAGLSVAIGRSIVKPVKRTAEVLDAVATGDLGQRLSKDSDDELGQMADALNTALERLAGAMRAIGDHAGSLASSSEELTSVSSQLASTANDTSAQASLVSAAAEQVSTNVSTVAAGTGEMTASIQEISHNAQDAVGVASSAVHMAQQTNDTMAKLGESSSEIGSVVRVITSIAEQTNLLALNATIEAARAGEAGKGFAVVAHEVKELARATATATNDISERITAIQSDVDAAVAAIGEITGIIGRVGDTQSSIASAVEQQTATTNEIGRNVAEAAHGSAEIAANIDGMARSAQEVSIGAGHTLETATDLSRMASELSDLVGSFRT